MIQTEHFSPFVTKVQI